MVKIENSNNNDSITGNNIDNSNNSASSDVKNIIGTRINNDELSKLIIDLIPNEEVNTIEDTLASKDSIDHLLHADCTPIVASGKYVIELVTGKHAVIGEKLSRVFAACDIVLGLIPHGKIGGKLIGKGIKEEFEKLKIFHQIFFLSCLMT